MNLFSRQLRLHPLGWLLFIFVLILLLISHGLILFNLSYQPWQGLDRADQGFFFDIATAAAFGLAGLLQIRLLPLSLPWIRRLMVVEFWFLGLFLFVDFIYFTQFGTHLPFSTTEYLGTNPHFALTLLYEVFSWEFLWLVLLPSLAWGGLTYLWVRCRPLWFLTPVRLVDLLVCSMVICVSGGLPFWDGPLNLTPPLISNGPIYFLWSYNFEPQVSRAQLQQDQALINTQLSGSPTKLTSEYPLIRRHQARGCRMNSPLAQQLCRQKRPNIIFIFLKSFRTHELGVFGSPAKLSPGFDRLAKEGILFSRFYANGVDPRHALVAALCSQFPNSGTPALKGYPDREFYCLPQLLKAQGYQRSVVTGPQKVPPLGRLTWTKLGFAQVIRASQPSPNRSQLSRGISDKEVYNRFLNHLSKTKEPFFSALFSQNNQYPFEVPQGFKLTNTGTPMTAYQQAFRYTDSQLYRLIQLSKTQAWWAHTLVFIFGETSNSQPPGQTPKNELDWVSLYSQVPLLILGGPINRRLEIRTTHDQLDLAPTVADLMRTPYQAPFAGTSLLSNQHQVAFSIRPGNYQAAWNNQGAVVLNQDGAFFHQPGMNRQETESLVFLSNSWGHLQTWLLQENRLWPKEVK